VVTGFIFLLRGMGIAFNEVVVTLLDEPNSTRSLRRFTVLLTLTTSLMLLLVSATPLAKFWFEQISALSPVLASLAHNALWLAFLLPGLNTLQSWYQGAILYSKKTRGITEAVAVFIVAISVILWGGVVLSKFVGLYIGIIAFSLGMLVQTIWLWYRSRPAIRMACERDARIGD
jgi:Na+-driven multidrug efflux pump